MGSCYFTIDCLISVLEYCLTPQKTIEHCLFTFYFCTVIIYYIYVYIYACNLLYVMQMHCMEK